MVRVCEQCGVGFEILNIVAAVYVRPFKVPYGTKYHYMLNIWSIFIRFEQQKGLGQICHLIA